MFSQFLLWIKTFVVQDEEGQTLVEYALIIALIAIVLIAALGLLGTDIEEIFGRIGGALDSSGVTE